MDKPKAGTVLEKVGYWKEVTYPEPVNGKRFPEWAFDFISVHDNSSTWGRPHWGLCAPLSLVDSKTGKRPEWEYEVFSNQEEAEQRAISLATDFNTFVVECG